MSKFFEDLLIVNIGGLFVFVVGVTLALLWGKMFGEMDRDQKFFIAKLFLAIWAAGNILFLVIR